MTDTNTCTERLAIFGDIGARLDPFKVGLQALGVDTDHGLIPPGLTVIALGNVIHGGSDSDAVASLISALMTASPGQWVQLLGPEEASHLGGPAATACRCGADTITRVRTWWRVKQMSKAVALRLPGQDLLASHSGLGFGAWDRMENPASPTAAALDMNAMMDDEIWQTFGFGGPNHGASMLANGVLTTLAGTGIYSSWENERAPFGQIHAADSIVDFATGEWSPDIPAGLQKSSIVQDGSFRTEISVGGKTFYTICSSPAGVAGADAAITPFVTEGVVGRG